MEKEHHLMLCEEHLTFQEWLDWFYEELPFLQNKHLTFINPDGSLRSLYDINGKWLVTFDHTNYKVYVGGSIEIKLNNLSLYSILNLNHQNELDQMLIEQGEYYENYHCN